MNYQPIEPKHDTTPELCREALQKGLGRTRMWAEAGTLDVAELLHACTNDLRYDQQCEDRRDDWLWMIIQAGCYTDVCEPLILKAVNELPDERSADQVCKLSMKFALLGRERFKTRLFEIVRDKHVDDDLTLAEAELVEVAGTDGFLVAAAKRGERLQEAEWDWDDGLFVRSAVEKFGESQVRDCLDSAATDDVKRFRSQWLTKQTEAEKQSDRQSHRDRMRLISFDAVFEAARSEDRCHWLRGWGMHADQELVDLVLKTVIASDDPEFQSRLLKVFMRRELPWVPGELFGLCHSEHEHLAFVASRALEGKAHVEIRRFALGRLEEGDVGRAMDLLASNFESGDEDLVAQSIRMPECDDERHSLMMSCRSFLEENENANVDPLAFLIYDHTPCSLCRTAAVKLLKRQSIVPDWMIDEVRFDCDEGTRLLFYPQPSQPT